MSSEKEFKVNDYITLRLEGGTTNIYIKGELFQQCKFLLLNIPVEEISSFDEIESIDEAAEKLGWTEDGQLGIIYDISPETEFWGHSSNLQAWVENYYDTRLLHSNLAFPLLRRLVEEGDLDAKRVFKEEIANRINSGHLQVMVYLLIEGYLEYFNEDEIKTLFDDLNIPLNFNNFESNPIIIETLFTKLKRLSPSYLGKFVLEILNNDNISSQKRRELLNSLKIYMPNLLSAVLTAYIKSNIHYINSALECINLFDYLTKNDEKYINSLKNSHLYGLKGESIRIERKKTYRTIVVLFILSIIAFPGDIFIAKLLLLISQLIIAINLFILPISIYKENDEKDKSKLYSRLLIAFLYYIILLIFFSINL